MHIFPFTQCMISSPDKIFTIDLRLELCAFFSINNVGVKHVVFHDSFPCIVQLSLSEVDVPKSLFWESAVRWTAMQNKRLFC